MSDRKDDITPRRDRAQGSRPPPTKRPSTSSLSILFVMGLIILGAFVASGSVVPVDPNGPDGPPTLGPYYNSADYPVQHIVTPTGQQQAGAKKNLQLQTFQVNNCGQNTAMLFVIDTSGSMSYDNKIYHEKTALNYFTSNMGGLSVIGIDTFGGEQGDVKTQVPLNFYKDVKGQVQTVINGLTPNGGTPTRDAMELGYQQLQQAINENEYPGYTYNLILITDGVPEILPPRTCEEETPDPKDAPLDRCFALDEDPRGAPPVGDKLKEEPSTNTSPPIRPNIPAEIKNLGANIYTINVYSESWTSDKYMLPYLTALLQETASQPTSTHSYISADGNTLQNVLQNIDNAICQANLNGAAPSGD